jgi:hypothetical protein
MTNLRQRLKRSKWLATAYHEASHAVATVRLGRQFDYIEVNSYNTTKGRMIGDDADDPKVTALIALQGCLFEHWLSPSIPVGSDDSDARGDWDITLECGWSLGLVNSFECDMEEAVRQRLVPEAEQLFHQHFDDIVTLGEALRKKGRGGRMTETECREAMADAAVGAAA